LEEIEIPPLPTIETPLIPPEMAELTPLEPVREDPPAKVEPQKPSPILKPKPATQKNSASKNGNEGKTGSGGSSAPTLFSGGGKSGRFPSPSYPASARSNGLQGFVRLLVVVESSGLPGSVSVESSSGHTSLDSAASDHVRRRWRWPTGEVRRYIVPIRFVLQ
jgi:protein TonB